MNLPIIDGHAVKRVYSLTEVTDDNKGQKIT